jgi:TatD DNase family protein
MKLIDIAVNLSDPIFKGFYRQNQIHPCDISSILSRQNYKILITCTDLENTRESILLADKYGLYCTAGFHPTSATKAQEGWAEMVRGLAWLLRHTLSIITRKIE